MKKALQLASVASMIDQFNMPNIELLQFLGYHVDVVADFTNPGTISSARAAELARHLESMDVRVIDTAIPRNPDPKAIYKAYGKVKRLINAEHYDLIHCHSPIGGAVARLAAKKERENGTRVIYTAHGFHFYNGAPLKNWIIFYPAEKWLSRYTDILITINQEDYRRATERFHAKRTVYVPGVGIDTEKFGTRYRGSEIRKEFGIGNDDILLLSVGELNENKNHEIAIKALAKLGRKPYYVIVGKGEKETYLQSLIMQLGLTDYVKLAGFRSDAADFYNAADVFVFPSFREGLPVALMEAMASGLPVVCGRIRGNTDLIDDGSGGFFFDPYDVDSVVDAIQKILGADMEKYGSHNLEKVRGFDIHIVEKYVSEVYGGGTECHLRGILDRAKKRAEIGVPPDEKLLVSIGELSVRKNHRVVIEALNNINDPDVYYIIVGKGTLKDELKKLDTTGRLKLLGYRTDIAELLHASDLFVFPSIQEGLPVALMEAMAVGLPIVASRIRGNVDLIEDDVNGLLVGCHDVKGFARGIEKLLKNENNSKAILVNKKKMLLLDSKNVIEQMKEIYMLNT